MKNSELELLSLHRSTPARRTALATAYGSCKGLAGLRRSNLQPRLAQSLWHDSDALNVIWATSTYRKIAMQAMEAHPKLANRMVRCKPTCGSFKPNHWEPYCCGRAKLCPHCRYRLVQQAMYMGRHLRGLKSSLSYCYRRQRHFEHICQFQEVKAEMDEQKRKLTKRLGRYVAFQNLRLWRNGSQEWSYIFSCVTHAAGKRAPSTEAWEVRKQPYCMSVVQGLRYPGDNLLFGPALLLSLQEPRFRMISSRL